MSPVVHPGESIWTAEKFPHPTFGFFNRTHNPNAHIVLRSTGNASANSLERHPSLRRSCHVQYCDDFRECVSGNFKTCSKSTLRGGGRSTRIRGSLAAVVRVFFFFRFSGTNSSLVLANRTFEKVRRTFSATPWSKYAGKQLFRKVDPRGVTPRGFPRRTEPCTGRKEPSGAGRPLMDGAEPRSLGNRSSKRSRSRCFSPGPAEIYRAITRVTLFYREHPRDEYTYGLGRVYKSFLRFRDDLYSEPLISYLFCRSER